MKFSLAAALLLGAAGQAAAQASCLSVALQVPQCGQACLESAAGVAGCGLTDFACQCSSSQSAKISTLAETCVIKSCGVQTGQVVASSAAAVCKCAGAGSGSGSGSSSPATNSATPSSSGSESGSATPMGSSMSATGGSTTPSSSASIQTGAAPTAGLGALGGVAAGVLGLAAML